MGWIIILQYSIDQEKLFSKTCIRSTGEIFSNKKKSVQDDFYKTLNLSAWELMYNVK